MSIKNGIMTLNFRQRSLLFAKISSIAYLNKENATKQAKKLGFTTIEYYDVEGAQSYRFMNNRDLVIACRGTEPTQYADIKADANALPVIAETVSRVHKGFKDQVDMLWPAIREDLTRTQNKNKDVWFTGHSLGAAMATIATSRLQDKVDALYTYGSPRTGTKKFVTSIRTPHYRHVNNNDMVTCVPFALLGYRHNASPRYINYYGNIRACTKWQRTKDKWRGRWRALKKGMPFDGAYDHGMNHYCKYTEKNDDK